ncbi:MAG: hypothetical protein K6G49_02010 [Candidatus Saccharibacteria bacterium]|nr:hypothetical protein [Candidatus Saccharibacteria bacterium]
MTLQELINAVMLKATGKPTILDQSNAKWSKIKGIANYYQNAWLNEPGQHWNSRYERARQIGNINNNDEYELDDDIADISTAKGDNVYVLTKEGEKKPFQLVTYDDLKNYPTGNYCAKLGQSLVFNARFAEDDPCYGGKLYAPVYTYVEDLEDPDDDVSVDNPVWLVTMCAAEYIRNDIVKQNQYGNLIAEANNLMQAMIINNRAGQVRRVRGGFRNGGGMYYD